MVFHYWAHLSLWITKQIQWERWPARGTLFSVPLLRYHKSSLWPGSSLASEKRLERPGCCFENISIPFKQYPQSLSINRNICPESACEAQLYLSHPSTRWGLRQKKRGTVKAPNSHLDFCPSPGSLWSQTGGFAKWEKRRWDERAVTSGAPPPLGHSLVLQLLSHFIH